jgi:hypothetical protein
MIIPGGVNDHSMMYILERVAAESFRFVLVNTDPLRGLSYHPSSVHRPPKIMYVYLPAGSTANAKLWYLHFWF